MRKRMNTERTRLVNARTHGGAVTRASPTPVVARVKECAQVWVSFALSARLGSTELHCGGRRRRDNKGTGAVLKKQLSKRGQACAIVKETNIRSGRDSVEGSYLTRASPDALCAKGNCTARRGLSYHIQVPLIYGQLARSGDPAIGQESCWLRRLCRRGKTGSKKRGEARRGRLR